MNPHAIRRAALRVLRAAGGFHVARWMTRRDLRILCYHGFSVRDEHEFRPALFITPTEFERRLAHLQGAGYRVLALDEAVRRLHDGTLPTRSACITIDDGFHSTLTLAAPLFEKYGVPATLYLTTYYVLNQDPIFNLTAAYLFWKTARPSIDLRGMAIEGVPDELVAWATLPVQQRDALLARIVRYGTTQLDQAGRRALLERLAERTDVSLAEIVRDRLFGLLTFDEARELERHGVDLQLHTHRHRSPGERAESERELADNLAMIARITPRVPHHFCYPSGNYDLWPGAWVSRFGVDSGTTCVPGFVTPATHRFQLGRFLDGSNIEQIEFEAELAGVLEIGRRLRAIVRHARAHLHRWPSGGAPGRSGARDRVTAGPSVS